MNNFVELNTKEMNETDGGAFLSILAGLALNVAGCAAYDLIKNNSSSIFSPIALPKVAPISSIIRY